MITGGSAFSGAESLAHDSVDVGYLEGPGVPESPAPPTPEPPSRTVVTADADSVALFAGSFIGRILARHRSAAARKPARPRSPRRVHPALVVVTASRRCAETERLLPPASAPRRVVRSATVPETVVVDARQTRRYKATTFVPPVRAGDAPPESINHGQCNIATRPPRKRSLGSLSSPPLAVEIRWRPDARGTLRGAAVALDQRALDRRAAAPRPQPGEYRVVQPWVAPRAGVADHHLRVEWRRSSRSRPKCERIGAPEVGVRRAVPAAPAPVETAWLREALTRFAAAAADAVPGEPEALDLVFKLGASNALHLLYCEAVGFSPPPHPTTAGPEEASAPTGAPRPIASAANVLLSQTGEAHAPRRPPSAPKRRPFGSGKRPGALIARCEKLFGRKIENETDVTVLAYLNADARGDGARRDDDIVRLAGEFSRRPPPGAPL